MNPVVFIFLITLFLANPAFGSDKLSGIIEGINDKYHDLPGLSVSYTREVLTRSMSMLGTRAKGDLATGKIYFRPPHCLRLEQEKPQAETIIANAENLWWYVPGKKRVHKYSSREFGKELELLSDIFRGLKQVEKRFRVTIVDQNDQGEYLVLLRPDPPWQDIERIRITVTPSFDIRVLEIFNQLGSITRFTLKDLAAKGDFKKDFFDFRVPDGVKLIEGGGNH